jgi:methyl-accepting chemotaxis protein
VSDEKADDNTKQPEAKGNLQGVVDRMNTLANIVSEIAKNTRSGFERQREQAESQQKQMDFLLNQQAQLTATVGQMAEKVDRTAGSITNLLAVAELQAGEIKDLFESLKIVDERTRHTDERLDVLVNTVERIISERQNGKGGA